MTYADIHARKIILRSDDGQYELHYSLMANQDGYNSDLCSYKGSTCSVSILDNGKPAMVINDIWYDFRYVKPCKALLFFIAKNSQVFTKALYGIDTAKYEKEYWKKFKEGYIDFRIKEFMNNIVGDISYEEAKAIVCGTE